MTAANGGARYPIAPKVTIGAKVRLIGGKSAGAEGVIHAKWTSHFGRGGPQLWIVRSDDLVRQRIMREDFLEVIP